MKHPIRITAVIAMLIALSAPSVASFHAKIGTGRSSAPPASVLKVDGTTLSTWSQDAKTGNTIAVYDTDYTPEAAMRAASASLEADGFERILEGATTSYFAKNGRLAMAFTYSSGSLRLVIVK